MAKSIAEVDRLGIADNTIIVVMGDNGPFMQYAGIGGVSDRVYRGGKTDTLDSIKHGPWASPTRVSRTCARRRCGYSGDSLDPCRRD